jgi:uncharacterized protein YbjT (DUF2867 family)
MAESTPPLRPRDALLAGATGLVGRQLLNRLIASPGYERVHALLRRPSKGLPSDPKLQLHFVDFGQLPPMPPVDDVFMTLGTTIAVAGSKEAFRRVDYDAVLNTARACVARGATRLIVISSLGADARSRIFYNRVKGQMEQAVVKLGYESVVIVQPSLLMGDRAAIAQPTRAGEEWTMRLLRPVMRFVPMGVRPIAAATVAQAMLDAAVNAQPGLRILKSGEMQSR